jgi:hypothetical protein
MQDYVKAAEPRSFLPDEALSTTKSFSEKGRKKNEKNGGAMQSGSVWQLIADGRLGGVAHHPKLKSIERG